MDKVQKNLNDVERKLGKANKIVAKGSSMTIGDAIKLGRKSNSVTSTIRKGIKEYDARPPCLSCVILAANVKTGYQSH